MLRPGFAGEQNTQHLSSRSRGCELDINHTNHVVPIANAEWASTWCQTQRQALWRQGNRRTKHQPWFSWSLTSIRWETQNTETNLSGCTWLQEARHAIQFGLNNRRKVSGVSTENASKRSGFVEICIYSHYLSGLAITMFCHFSI